MLKNLSELIDNYVPESGTILSCIRGSITHGTNNDLSDIDISEIYIGKLDFYFGFQQVDSFNKKVRNLDIAGHELRKAFGLLYKCNPDIINLLWTNEDYFIKIDEVAGRFLLDNKHKFISKLAYTSFSRYAISQFKKMESLTPEKLEELERVEKVLIEHGVPIPNTNVAQKIRSTKIEFILNPTESTRATICTIEGLINHYTYLNKKYFNGGGKLGAKRRQSIKEAGFNKKNAAHLLRLLKQGTEILTDGTVNVSRVDIDEVLLQDIKNGKYSLDEVKDMAKDLEADMNEAYEKSCLPETADYKELEEMCVYLLSNYYGTTNN